MNETRKFRGWAVVVSVLTLLWGLLPGDAAAFTVRVRDPQGNPVAGFKWLLETDNTHTANPGVHRPVNTTDVTQNTLSISLHKSHAPVVAQGVSASDSAVITGVAYPAGTGCSGGAGCSTLAAGRYIISVLPFGDGTTNYDMGGALIDTATQTEVTVLVRPLPFETAQIAVKVFHDILPLNAVWDPNEAGLAGFTVTLMEQAGDIIVDCFGNKLGTTYQFTDTNGNGQHDRGEPFVLDADGAPVVDQEGAGDFVTNAAGEVTIKYLCPGKYGV